MNPIKFDSIGNLEPGIYELTIEEVEQHFGFNDHRMMLIGLLKEAIADLKEFGCKELYLDGSFVTQKVKPGDYDVCIDYTKTNFKGLKENHPVFFNMVNERKAQKLRYGGEFFNTLMVAQNPPKILYLNFFQICKHTSKPKGIVKLKL